MGMSGFVNDGSRPHVVTKDLKLIKIGDELSPFTKLDAVLNVIFYQSNAGRLKPPLCVLRGTLWNNPCTGWSQKKGNPLLAAILKYFLEGINLSVYIFGKFRRFYVIKW